MGLSLTVLICLKNLIFLAHLICRRAEMFSNINWNKRTETEILDIAVQSSGVHSGTFWLPLGPPLGKILPDNPCGFIADPGESRGCSTNTLLID
jgi:hypothetical protein